jgi:hypothetical protein
VSNLNESIDVECAPFFALHHAERFFSVPRRDYTPGRLTLKLDLASLKLPGTVQARHDVRLTHALVQEGGQKKLALSWDPEDQVVPRFEGTLSTAAKEAGVATLTLDGTYAPPGGIAGAAFDLVVGRKIAAATAQALLAEMKAFVESDFRTARATNLAESPKE